MIRIDPSQRNALVEAFRAAPFGPHSAELQRVLLRLRWGGAIGKPMVVVTIPYREWAIALGPRERGEPIALETERFDAIDQAFCAVFERRLDALLEAQATAEA